MSDMTVDMLRMALRVWLAAALTMVAASVAAQPVIFSFEATVDAVASDAPDDYEKWIGRHVAGKLIGDAKPDVDVYIYNFQAVFAVGERSFSTENGRIELVPGVFRYTGGSGSDDFGVYIDITGADFVRDVALDQFAPDLSVADPPRNFLLTRMENLLAVFANITVFERVPEPGTAALLMAGTYCLVRARRGDRRAFEGSVNGRND